MNTLQPILFIRHGEPVDIFLRKDGDETNFDYTRIVHPSVSISVNKISEKILSGGIPSLGELDEKEIIIVHSLAERAQQTACSVARILEEEIPHPWLRWKIRMSLWLPEDHFYQDITSIVWEIWKRVMEYCDDNTLVIAVWHQPSFESAWLPNWYCEGAVFDLKTRHLIEKVRIDKK